ncbi:esterase/lipase family protein [Corynebacterium kroppenstedtii]|uniref:esterase/lipase family protein n=1 Tax=Corynebacterium sp. PCR 32 TaxID=3351342 RepID=UPI0030AD535F
MGSPLPEQHNSLRADEVSSHDPNPSPEGTNVDCTPHHGDNPVVLLHGFNSNAYRSFSRLAPALANHGKCVYAMNYGQLAPGIGDGKSIAATSTGSYGLGPMPVSLDQVSTQIDQVLSHTGAAKVDLVGYSQGGTLAIAYAKTHPSRVGKIVTISGTNRGTSLLGLSNLKKAMEDAGLPVGSLARGILGQAANDLLETSDFMMKLKEGDIEAPGVQYTAISSLADEAATPLSNTQFSSGNHRNIVLQDGCPGDLPDHLGTPYDPRAIDNVVNALGGNIPVRCSSSVGLFASM